MCPQHYNLIVPLSLYIGHLPTACTMLVVPLAYTLEVCPHHVQPYCTTELMHWICAHSMYNLIVPLSIYIGGVPTTTNTTLLFH